MELAARRLLLFSLASFALVIAFATVLGPAHKLVRSADAVRSMDLFHSHFDQLCWLGAAALGTALRHLAPAYSGPAWAPALLARAYPIGSATFAAAFVLRAVGQHVGSAPLTRAGFGAIASVGGVALVVSAIAAVAIVRAELQAAPSVAARAAGQRPR